MEKFIPKLSPKEIKLRKSFKKIGLILLFMFFLLWFIHSEAERVHKDIYSLIHQIQYQHEGGHK